MLSYEFDHAIGHTDITEVGACDFVDVSSD
jgi:hypothetical protein